MTAGANAGLPGARGVPWHRGVGGLRWTEAGGKAAAPLHNQWLRLGEHWWCPPPILPPPPQLPALGKGNPPRGGTNWDELGKGSGGCRGWEGVVVGGCSGGFGAFGGWWPVGTPPTPTPGNLKPPRRGWGSTEGGVQGEPPARWVHWGRGGLVPPRGKPVGGSPRPRDDRD